MDLKEINGIINDLENTRINKLYLKENVEKALIELSSSLGKVTVEASQIHENYKIVLDCYKNILNDMDSKFSSEEINYLVNLEHTKVMPEMVKKLYNIKNV